MGGTGAGKSMLTVTVIRQARIQGIGCCMIDPHGQTIRQIMLSEAAKEKPDEQTLHLLEPGPDCLFSFDPFEGLLHPGESPTSFLIAHVWQRRWTASSALSPAKSRPPTSMP